MQLGDEKDIENVLKNLKDAYDNVNNAVTELNCCSVIEPSSFQSEGYSYSVIKIELTADVINKEIGDLENIRDAIKDVKESVSRNLQNFKDAENAVGKLSEALKWSRSTIDEMSATIKETVADSTDSIKNAIYTGTLINGTVMPESTYTLNTTEIPDANQIDENEAKDNNESKNKVKVSLDGLREKFIKSLKDYSIEDEIHVAFNAIVVHEENDYNSNVDDIKYVDEKGVTHFRYDATESDIAKVANEKIGSLYSEDMTDEQKENARGLNDTVNRYLSDKIIGKENSEKSDGEKALQGIENALEEKGYKNVFEETYYTDKKDTLKEALSKETGNENSYDELMSSMKIISGGKNEYSDEEIQKANNNINRIIESIIGDETQE